MHGHSKDIDVIGASSIWLKHRCMGYYCIRLEKLKLNNKYHRCMGYYCIRLEKLKLNNNYYRKLGIIKSQKHSLYNCRNVHTYSTKLPSKEDSTCIQCYVKKNTSPLSSYFTKPLI